MANVITSKKKKSSAKLILGALIFGLLAAGFSYLYLTIREQEMLEAFRAREGRKIDVVVASRDLPQGAPINGNTMAIRQIPAELAYPDVVRPGEFTRYENNFLAKPLASGTPLLKTFVQQDVAMDFSDTIDLGRRAMAIQVDEINSISGFIRPGNRIDLYARLASALKGRSAEGGDVVIPLLQNIKVLATGHDSSDDYVAKFIEGGQNRNPFTYTTMTVDVSPKEAAILATAIDKGSLVALLRNRKDQGLASFTEIPPGDMFAYAAAAAENARVIQAANSLEGMRQLNEGDLVVRDGVVMTKDGRVLENFIANADGSISTRDGRLVVDSGGKMQLVSSDGKTAGSILISSDGKVIDNPSLVVKDGVVMTRDGVVLSGRGLTVNEKGQIVTADGKVVDPAELKVSRDGKIITADGTVLDDSSVLMTKDGRVLDPADVHITKDGFIITRDGTVMTADGKILNGVTVDENGEVVTADGTVLRASEIMIAADGTVRTMDGSMLAGVSAEEDAAAARTLKQLAGNGLQQRSDGLVVARDGTVMTKDGVILKGVTVGADGKLRSGDGTVIDGTDLVVNADGSVTTKDGTRIAGITADAGSEQAKLMQAVLRTRHEEGIALNSYEFIAGGSSRGGVADVRDIPIK